MNAMNLNYEGHVWSIVKTYKKYSAFRHFKHSDVFIARSKFELTVLQKTQLLQTACCIVMSEYL